MPTDREHCAADPSIEHSDGGPSGAASRSPGGPTVADVPVTVGTRPVADGQLHADWPEGADGPASVVSVATHAAVADDPGTEKPAVKGVSERERRAILVVVVLGGVLVVGLPAYVAHCVGSDELGEAVAVTSVLIAGFAGLSARGFGEMRGSAAYKAAGYFLGAIAFAFTTAFSLTGAFPLW